MSRRDSLITPDVLDGAAPDNRVALFVAIDSERDAVVAKIALTRDVEDPRIFTAIVVIDRCRRISFFVRVRETTGHIRLGGGGGRGSDRHAYRGSGNRDTCEYLTHFTHYVLLRIRTGDALYEFARTHFNSYAFGSKKGKMHQPWAAFAVRRPRVLAADVMADSYMTTSTIGKWRDSTVAAGYGSFVGVTGVVLVGQQEVEPSTRVL